jgi:endogenous inhibitor of DNA gyrase (YacG/DUF329 family)
MAQCPKCGKKLRITDISQFCPACGVNMRFVNFEENFYREAKIAELSQARMHVKVRKLKASFVGSKLAIARLIVMLLPIVSLLVPFGTFTIDLPYKAETFSLSGLGVYGLFNGGGLDYIMKMTAAAVNGARFTALRNALFAYAGVAVFVVLIFFVSVLGFISIKNMQKINVVLSGCGIIACVVSVILFRKFTVAVAESPMDLLSGRVSFGVLVCIAAFAIVCAVNVLLWRKGIPVEYDEGMLERVEVYKKVKSGEVDIDSLPQPIIETAETRKIDEEIAKERDEYQKKHGKEVTADGNG